MTTYVLPADGTCHPDCGPIVARSDDAQHAHENEDGKCWHDDEDGGMRCQHAGLHVGHIWTNVSCPAYRTLNGSDCTCEEG